MRRKILFPLLFIVLLSASGLTATLVSHSAPELGLDLQGGVSVVLAPTGQATGEQLNESVDIIRQRVDALGVAEPDIARQGDAIVVQLPGVKNRDRALALVGETAELRFRPVIAALGPASGGDNGGDSGSSSTTTPDGSTTTTPESSTTTAPPSSTTTGGNEGALGMVPGESAAGPLEQPTTTTTAPPPTTTAPPAGEPGQAPALTPRSEDKADATVVLADDGGNRYQLGPAEATGRIVESAQAELTNGAWGVGLTMRGGADGIDTFNQIAAQCNPPSPACPTGQLAIVLDSVVQSAPTIQTSNFARDQIQISGSFKESEAKNLALVLRYGSLPLELERQTVQTVSASLGEDSLHAGVLAGAVGLVLVAVYMILYYRALGMVVILGLAVWGSLLYSIVSWLGVTQGLALTLAGVTGIIVSIGVTVDSYVVFFERLKDEIRAGRTLRTSAERAFKRAFRTILAADISSFLGAAVLWWLTVGSVRGFAFFLGLSTVLDVAVAWFFTRPMVTSLSRNRVFTDMPFLGVARGLAMEGHANSPGRPVTTAGAAR